MAKHVFIYLAVYTLFLQLTKGMDGQNIWFDSWI